MPNTCGWSRRSQNVSIDCDPATGKRSAPALAHGVHRAGEQVGPCRVSASVKSRNSPRAASCPLWHAHCLPNQPSGRSGLSITVTRGSLRGDASRDLPRAVGRVVVHDDHLDDGHVVARIERTHVLDVPRLVARGDDDRDERRIAGTRRRDMRRVGSASQPPEDHARHCQPRQRGEQNHNGHAHVACTACRTGRTSRVDRALMRRSPAQAARRPCPLRGLSRGSPPPPRSR